MRCRVLKLRKFGMAIPKYQVRQGTEHEPAGTLEIFETHESSLGRSLRIAQFRQLEDQSGHIETLYEPQLLWIRGDRLVLSGFEKVISDGNRIDYAQSWLCELDVEPEL